MLKVGAAVEVLDVDGHREFDGEVVGYGFQRPFEDGGGHHCSQPVYLVAPEAHIRGYIGRGDQKTYVSVLVVHPDNLREVQ